MKHPVFKIIDDIVESKNISESDKLLALEDIRLMYADKEYFKKCYVKYHSHEIYNHHIWCSSKLGYMFWIKIYKQLTK